MEQSRPLTNRFLSVTISRFESGVQPPLIIQASLDGKHPGQVSIDSNRISTNPIELKLQPIVGGIIQQKLILELVAADEEDEDNHLVVAAYEMDLSSASSSLLNLTTYGYFTMPIRLQDADDHPSAQCWINLQINNRNFDFSIPENEKNVILLPKHDPTFNFLWRIRIDVRQAVDLPAGSSTYVECHWTMADNSVYDPSSKEDFYESYRTAIQENQTNPFYNTQFLMNNPYYKLGGQVFNNVQGYISFIVYNTTNQIIEEVYFPVASLKPFVPLNIELQSIRKEYKIKPKYYLSLTLEQQPTDGKGMCDVIIHNFHLSPQLPEDPSLQIMLTSPNFTPKAPAYTNIEVQPAGKMAKALEKAAKPKELMFISSVNSLQPIQSDQFYGAIAVFTLPLQLISSKVQLFAMSRDPKIKQTHSLANSIIGNSEGMIDSELQALQISEVIESKSITVKWNKNSKLFDKFSKLAGSFELGLLNQKDSQKFLPREQTPVISEPSIHQSQVNDNDMDDIFKQDDLNNEMNNNMNNSSLSKEDQKSVKSQVSRQSAASALNKAVVGNNEEKSFQGSDVFESQIGEAEQQLLEIERWKVLSRELAQKQEMIHRMDKELEEKQDSLKSTGEEITDLRKKNKVLKGENDLLLKRLSSEQEIEAKSKPTKEIWQMQPETLKLMVVKVATAYRDERLKNEEFDRQIKEAYNEIIKAKHSSEQLENLQKERLSQAHKLTDLKELLGKAQVYRDTIVKQEKIIQKLEQAMEVTLKGSEQIKQREKELQQLKEECEGIQSNMRARVFNSATSEIERAKREFEKLEIINKELQSQLSAKQRPSSTGEIDLYQETLELEAQSFNISSKVEALQEQLNRTAQDHARDISELRANIARKQAYLNSNPGTFYS